MTKVPDTPENMKSCICVTCPTYKKCGLTGGLFCAKGKAKEKAIREGCVCAKCSVYVKYDLKGSYFCRKPTKLLWWILGLAIILIIIAVIAWLILSGSLFAPPTESIIEPTPTPTIEATPTPMSTPVPIQTPTPAPELPTAPPSETPVA